MKIRLGEKWVMPCILQRVETYVAVIIDITMIYRRLEADYWGTERIGGWESDLEREDAAFVPLNISLET